MLTHVECCVAPSCIKCTGSDDMAPFSGLVYMTFLKDLGGGGVASLLHTIWVPKCTLLFCKTVLLASRQVKRRRYQISDSLSGHTSSSPKLVLLRTPPSLHAKQFGKQRSAQPTIEKGKRGRPCSVAAGKGFFRKTQREERLGYSSQSR